MQSTGRRHRRTTSLGYGYGIDDPAYQDIVIPDGAPTPVDFDHGILPSDHTEELGLGQLNVEINRERDVNNMEEVMMVEVIHGETWQEQVRCL